MAMAGIVKPGAQLRPAGDESIKGKRFVIVGGTGGLGRALALYYAQRGGSVVVVGRTFRDQGTAGLDFVAADLTSMKEARRIGQLPVFADADVVLLTTGIMAAKTREQTAEGVERDFAVSHLNRFVLLREAAPRMKPRARVFVMAFPGTGAKGDPADANSDVAPYEAMKAHGQTVAANEALVLDVAKRYAHVDAYGINPGLVATEIRSNFMGAGSWKARLFEGFISLLTPTPEQYAARIAPLLVADDLAAHRGFSVNPKGKVILPSEGFDDAFVAAWTEASQRLADRALAT